MIFVRGTIIWLFVIFSQLVVAQNRCSLVLDGIVKGDQGELLIGATIQLLPTNKISVTNEKGRYIFEGVCPDDYRLVVQYVGYESKEIAINLMKSSEQIVSLKQVVTELNEVVVEDKLDNTDHANNYAVLSEKQLTETAGKSLGESLREISGVNTIQAGPGIFKPVIHGVHSQRVLILNHGIRQEGQQWGAEHAPEIDPFTASNIVVVKDASSIKYGTDALGGVVVVNPAPLPEKAGFGGSLVNVFQSNGRSITTSGMIEGGIKKWEGWGWRIQGTVKRAGDFHTPTYSLTNTGIKENDFSVATGYHSEQKGLEIFFSHFQSEIGILRGTAVSNLEDLQLAIEREPPQYTRSFSYSIDEPRQEVSHNLLKLNGHVVLPKGLLRAQYGFQQNNRKEFDIRKGELAGIPAINLQLFTHTLELEWETTYHKNNSLCIGATGMIQLNNNIEGTKQIPFIPNFSNTSGGMYAISKVKSSTWNFDVGVRYDYRYYEVAGYDFKNELFRDQLRFHNVSATTGASKSLNKYQSISFSLNSAWRPPHVAELYSLGTHQSAAANEYGLLLNDSSAVMNINDVSFHNEQALKFVSGYNFSRNRLSLDVAAYANYIFNYIYLQPRGITKTLRGVFPFFRYTQTDALFLGVDLTGAMQLNSHFTSSAKISLLRASDQSNHDYLVFIPPNRYEVGLKYEAEKFYHLYVEAKVKYTAKQNRAPRVITPAEFRVASEQGVDLLETDQSNFDFVKAPDAYSLVSISSGMSIHREKVKYDVRFSADNLLNTSYREYTNRFRYFADEIGRNFILTLKCTF